MENRGKLVAAGLHDKGSENSFDCHDREELDEEDDINDEVMMHIIESDAPAQGNIVSPTSKPSSSTSLQSLKNQTADSSEKEINAIPDNSDHRVTMKVRRKILSSGGTKEGQKSPTNGSGTVSGRRHIRRQNSSDKGWGNSSMPSLFQSDALVAGDTSISNQVTRSARKHRTSRKERRNEPDDRRFPLRSTIERRRQTSTSDEFRGSSHNHKGHNDGKDVQEENDNFKSKLTQKSVSSSHDKRNEFDLEDDADSDGKNLKGRRRHTAEGRNNINSDGEAPKTDYPTKRKPRRRGKLEAKLDIDGAFDDKATSHRTLKVRLRERRTSSRRGKARSGRSLSKDAERVSKSLIPGTSGTRADGPRKHRKSADDERLEREFELDKVAATPKEPQLRIHRGRSPHGRSQKPGEPHKKSKALGTSKGRRGLSIDAERMHTGSQGLEKSKEKNQSRRSLSMDAERMRMPGKYENRDNVSLSSQKVRRGRSADASQNHIESGKPRSYRRKVRNSKSHDDDDRSVGSKKSSTHRRRRKQLSRQLSRKSSTRLDNETLPSSKEKCHKSIKTGSGSLSRTTPIDDINRAKSTGQNENSESVESVVAPTQPNTEKVVQEPVIRLKPTNPSTSQIHQIKVEQKGKGGMLSKHLQSTPPKQPEELEERSETSQFTNTYQSTPELVQFDPTSINNFMTLNQQKANVKREDIKLADGTKSQLQISELHNLPTFQVEQSSLNDSEVSSKTSSKKFRPSLTSFGSFGSLASLTRQNSFSSIGHGSKVRLLPPTPLENKNGRIYRGLTRANSANFSSNTAERLRGTATTNSFFSRVRTQAGQVPPRNPFLTRALDSSNTSDGKPKSFIGNLISPSDQSDERARHFFNRDDQDDGEDPKHPNARFFFTRELEHQALDDDDESR